MDTQSEAMEPEITGDMRTEKMPFAQGPEGAEGVSRAGVCGTVFWAEGAPPAERGRGGREPGVRGRGRGLVKGGPSRGTGPRLRVAGGGVAETAP